MDGDTEDTQKDAVPRKAGKQTWGTPPQGSASLSAHFTNTVTGARPEPTPSGGEGAFRGGPAALAAGCSSVTWQIRLRPPPFPSQVPGAGGVCLRTTHKLSLTPGVVEVYDGKVGHHWLCHQKPHWV